MKNPRKLSPKQIEELCSRYIQGDPKERLIQKFGICRTSLEGLIARRGLKRGNSQAVRGKAGYGYDPRFKLTPFQAQEICSLYAKGKCAAALAQKFEVSLPTIQRLLRKHRIRRESKITSSHIGEICTRYQTGETEREIAESLGIGTTTVHRILKKHSIKRRPYGVEGEPYKLTLAQIGKICAQYLAGEPVGKLATEFDISISTIDYYLKKRGIKRRRNYAVDHAFFSTIDTEEKAYWLGFAAADGCLTTKTHSFSIQLSDLDLEHLLKLKKSINSEHPIGHNKARRHSCLTITSQQMAIDLIKHGIVPRKTFLLQWPTFLSDELLRHYLRGYFDGDGGFSLIRTGKNAGCPQVNFGITSNRAFLEGAQEFLIRLCSLSKTVINGSCSKDPRIGRLSYGGNRQVARIAHLLYDGATLYLERKCNKVKHLL